MRTRARIHTMRSGTFQCPRERGSRRYDLRRVRTWLTLGIVGVVPLRERSRFVECRVCRSTFDPDVLERLHQPVEDVLTSALRCALAAVFAGRRLSEATRRGAVIVLQRHATQPYRLSDLDADLARESARRGSALDRLERLSHQLNSTGRETLAGALAQLSGIESPRSADTLAAIESAATTAGVPTALLQRALGSGEVSRLAG